MDNESGNAFQPPQSQNEGDIKSEIEEIKPHNSINSI